MPIRLEPSSADGSAEPKSGFSRRIKLILLTAPLGGADYRSRSGWTTKRIRARSIRRLPGASIRIPGTASSLGGTDEKRTFPRTRWSPALCKLREATEARDANDFALGCPHGQNRGHRPHMRVPHMPAALSVCDCLTGNHRALIWPFGSTYEDRTKPEIVSSWIWP